MSDVKRSVIALIFQLQGSIGGQLPRYHANLLDVTDLAALRELGVVHRTELPYTKVAGLHIDLGHVAGFRLEPLDVLLTGANQVRALTLR